jgi:uncharacterized protein (TIGR02001 family)
MTCSASLRHLACVLAFTASASNLCAQEEAGDIWSVDAAVTVVSDYRFRGFSLSDKEPAVQPEFSISHKSGVYVGFWGSTLADNGGEDIETDFSIGFARSFGAFDVDIYAMWYLYPGASDLNYVELTSNLTTAVGPAEVGLELGYAPAQSNIGGVDNRYAALHASVPLGKLPLSVNGSFGLEDGSFGDNKLDWSFGLSGELAGFELGASYIDAARHGHDPLADPTVVLSVKKSF